MNAVLLLDRIAEAERHSEREKSPSAYMRTLSTPAAPPWDQTRAAELEARLGAPLPLTEIVYQLRRLEAWRPGRPARFMVCYVRSTDVAGQPEFVVPADGRLLKFQFVSRAERVRQSRRNGLVAAVAVGLTAFIVVATAEALAVRVDTEARLRVLEQTAAARLHQARLGHQQSVESRLLNSAGARRRGLDQVLADLAWASAAKTAGAHIDAFHWRRGYFGVEVRGEGEPFVKPDRPVFRAKTPLRPNVWLWGVGEASPENDHRP